MEIMTDDIEQAYASAVEQSQEPEKTTATGEETNTASSAPEEVISAPASYKQEYKDSFASLPREWQKYLASREKEMKQGLSRARNEYNWVNNAFNSRKESLAAQGYKNAREYFETLAGIADALDKNPETTIAQLQALYNVGAPANDNNLQKQMNSLALAQSEMRNYLQNVQNERIKSEFDAFLKAKDENGNPKHPYFAEVKEEMAALFNAGLAKNYEDAYAKAIWQVESVRDKIVAEKTKAEIAAKANDAKSAKMKAFNPTSKADDATKELSLEEEIALNFDKFNGA